MRASKNPQHETTPEAEIRALIDEFVAAVHAKDVERATAHCAPNILFFGVAPPLQMTGSSAYRKNAAEWFATWDGPLELEMRDLVVTASDRAAFMHALNHVHGIKTTGDRVDMWYRATVCFEKLDGRWMVTHEHISEPFDMQSFKALLDLQP